MSMAGDILNLEKSEDTELKLPEIPKRFVRLTHFTNERFAERLINGEDFPYDFLSSHVDSFSDNSQILELVKTGKAGNFSKRRFGPVVVLMDLENEEFKERYMGTVCTDASIPNHNILGYVREDSEGLEFVENLKYDPVKNELQYIPKSEIPLKDIETVISEDQNTKPIDENIW